MRIRHRLARLEALESAREDIAARVHAMTPEERHKLKRRLEAQIHGELLGARGQASELRREKCAFTLACIDAVETATTA